MTDLLCPHCETRVDEHPANLCLNQWVAVEVMDGRLENYSATIAAAWEVVEKLIADNLFPGVGFEENTWDAWVFREEPIEGQLGSHVKARHPNVCLSICRAALKAEGAK